MGTQGFYMCVVVISSAVVGDTLVFFLWKLTYEQVKLEGVAQAHSTLDFSLTISKKNFLGVKAVRKKNKGKCESNFF